MNTNLDKMASKVITVQIEIFTDIDTDKYVDALTHLIHGTGDQEYIDKYIRETIDVSLIHDDSKGNTIMVEQVVDNKDNNNG